MDVRGVAGEENTTLSVACRLLRSVGDRKAAKERSESLLLDMNRVTTASRVILKPDLAVVHTAERFPMSKMPGR